MQKICSVDTHEKSGFYELLQQNNLLKTMEMNEAWPDIHDEGFTHQF